MTPLHGAACLLRGLAMLRRPGIRVYAAVPLAVNAALFAGLAVYLSYGLNRWVDALMPALPHWLAWLHWLVWGAAAAAALVLSFFTVSLLANLIAAPFNERLAQRVEHYLSGEAPAAPVQSWHTAAGAALRNELGKLRYFAVRAIPLLLLYLIPGVNLAAPFLWLAFSVWMLALEYIDYPMGNHGLHFQHQRGVLARQRGAAMGFGGAVLLLTSVPLLNLAVMPAAVAGATVLWVERLRPRAEEIAAGERAVLSPD